MKTKDCPQTRYINLRNQTTEPLTDKQKRELLNKIDAIDDDTPWQEVEPTWWVEMMEFAKQLKVLPTVNKQSPF